MAIRIDISDSDRAHSVPFAPSSCLLANAARRQWGGEWSFTRREIRSTIGGRDRYYRHTAGSLLTMAAHDLRLPTRSYVRIRPTRMNYRERRMYRRAAAYGGLGVVAVGVFVTVWIPVAAGVIILAVLFGKAALGRQQHAADQEADAMPSFAALRAMPAHERQAVLRPRPLETAQVPARASLPAPGPVSRSWPQAGELPTPVPASSPVRGS